ncbi:hypothetical protein M405DRAFT_157640 [Rhizopogon salebrosus TDB-379]|nr:hypothetical protein M405DRAFT_157640 [Rhizopogon salebrosus TDB-379]
MSERAVQALISAPSFAVLPNLRTLEWFDDRDCFFPLLRTLLVPTITSLTLGCTPTEPWDPSFIKSALLGSLGARCPSIRKFVCAYKAGSEMSSDAVSAAICGWRNLVHLETGVINARALVHLASLPSLKSLHFRSSDHIDDMALPNSIPSFISNLDQVCIAAPSHSHLTRCLRNVRFLSCRSVVISMYHDLEPYHPDIPELIVSFSKCFSPVLEELFVKLRFDLSNLDVDEPDNHRLAFGFDVIAPLLSFSRLTKLDLDWFCPLNVDDNGLKDMVQCWPQLEEFHFGVSTAMLVPPSVTFIGLVHPLQHCRHLRNIHMSFRACPIDIDCEPFSKTIPNMKVTHLEVGDSPIVDPIVVACQLHMLLPNLNMAIHGLWTREPMPPSIVTLNDEWDRANEYLQVLTKGAEMRERMGPPPEE